MSTPRLLGEATNIKALADRLSRCSEVTRFDDAGAKETWIIAESLGHLEESFRKFLDEQLPRLVGGEIKESEMYDLLLDIGEEFRHILYHINEPRFYRYLDGD